MVYEYYRTLGLPKDVTDDDIKKAYKHLALFYNPKRYSRRPKTPEDPLMSKKEKAMKEYAEELHRSTMYMSISEAFDVLSDPQKRAIYDQFGEKALKEGLIGDEGFIPPYVYHGDPDTTFREFFGTDNPFTELILAACAPVDSFVSKEAQGYRPKGSPVLQDLPITLEQAYNGAIRKVMLAKKFLCADQITQETRDHALTIEVPPGADEGMEFNFPSEGDQIPNTQPADIIFRLKLQDHPVYKREKDNLILTVSVNLYEALCGVIIPVNTLDGRSFRVFNVHLIQPGFEKIIAGEGMPILNDPNRKKGDLIIRFKVRYPNKLNQAQKQQLKIALDPQFQSGGSCYDRRPPATLVVPKRCICPDDEDGIIPQN